MFWVFLICVCLPTLGVSELTNENETAMTISAIIGFLLFVFIAWLDVESEKYRSN